ncbi:tetratricopeptide repeat protein [Xanthobacter autotrophicus]|uniref:tetratricopeptide repeat protein n=1 Tax=Xanthobacter autotrophicus TaxID=280 RepID=UPI0024A74BB6|nr:tetratricopeptide repeat protein [Xanthobacter autotrophicus]MDI4659239.1 tetratricopeptide repeat protein [Xanthobacter autotrophicus]
MVTLSTGAGAQSVLPGERVPVPLPGVPAGPSAGVPPGEAASPRPRLPKDKRTQIEGLFAALKVAPDDRSSKMIADRLDQLFSDSGSSSVDLLMARAGAAAEAKAFDLALQILDQVIEIEPDDLGALSKRATLLYMRDDYGGALADIREVLAREPRHFAMLYGLALIMRELGDDKRALEALRKARAVNPRLDGADEMESQLSLKVEGRGI